MSRHDDLRSASRRGRRTPFSIARARAVITFIDSRDVYPWALAEYGGTPEEILGRWLAGKRHRFIVATKAVGKTGEAAWDQGASRKHLFDAVDASLRRLRVEYIDLYQLHSDDRIRSR